MRVLFLCVTAVLAQEFPPPLLGTASSRCYAEIETPIDIPADPTYLTDEFGGTAGLFPFQIPTTEIIRFSVNSSVSKIHYHFDSPELPEDFPFTLKAMEIDVKQDDGKLLHHSRFDPEIAGGGIIPPTPADQGTFIVANMIAIYGDDAGNEFSSDPVFFPPADADMCCPMSHPPPQVFPEDFDRLPVGPNDHFEGADFVLHKGEFSWSWWCHNGAFKSCYVTPEGFVDTNLERFQEVGGVATFFDENGNPARFECIFRTEGNDAAGPDGKGNRVDGDLSGSFVRIDAPVLDDLPISIPGIHASECVVLIDSPIDLPADPTIQNVDPAHTAGSMPFVFPPDEHVNISAVNLADRLHAHWSLPEIEDGSGLELIGFELTVYELGTGRILSRLIEGPDVIDQHLDVSNGDINFMVQASVVAIYTNEDGQELRSAEQFYPKTTLDACPLNLPPPHILPADIDRASTEGETDGGFYTVTKTGRTWSYFCNNGKYKSCFHPPAGFDDPNSHRFQEIGGKSLFRNIETGEHVEFVCALAENGDNPSPFDGVFGELSGRFVSVLSLTGDDETQAETVAGVSEASSVMTVLLLSLCFVLFLLFAGATYTAVYYRRKLREKTDSHTPFQQLQPLSEA